MHALLERTANHEQLAKVYKTKLPRDGPSMHSDHWHGFYVIIGCCIQ